MATVEEEYYLRSSFLLLKGGTFIARKVLTREEQQAGRNLGDLIVDFERVLKHKFRNHKQMEKLFPPGGNTKVEDWDISLLTGVLEIVFRSSLSDKERRAVRSIKYQRNEVYAHRATADLFKDNYTDICDELNAAFTFLASGFDTEVQIECNRLIRQCLYEPLDIKSHIEHLKRISDTDDMFNDILKICRTISNTQLTKSEITSVVKDAVLQALQENRHTCTRKVKVVDAELEVSGKESDQQTIDLVEQIVTTVIDEANRRTQSSEEHIAIGIAVQEILHEIGSKTGITALGAELGCVTIRFNSCSYEQLLSLLNYLESEDMKQRLNKLAIILSRHFNMKEHLHLSVSLSLGTLESILAELDTIADDTCTQTDTFDADSSLAKSSDKTELTTIVKDAVLQALQEKRHTCTRKIKVVDSELEVSGKESDEPNIDLVEQLIKTAFVEANRRTQSSEKQIDIRIAVQEILAEIRSNTGIKARGTERHDVMTEENRLKESVTAFVSSPENELHVSDGEEIHGSTEVITEEFTRWEREEVNIAVIGRSGSGKSTLVNALRGIENKSNADYAPTGCTKTTEAAKCYVHPKNQNVNIWLLPGYDTLSIAFADYLDNEKINVKPYDVFIITTGSRIYANDINLAKELEKRKLFYLFVRSKCDQDIDNANQDEVMQILPKIRKDCLDNLKQSSIEKKEIYLISGIFRNHPNLDFEKLSIRILDHLTDLKRDVLLFSMPVTTEVLLDKLISELKRRIWLVTTVSCTGAAVPIPGLSHDLSVINKEIELYKTQLGLNKENLEKVMKFKGIGAKEMFEKVQFKSMTLIMVPYTDDFLIEFMHVMPVLNSIAASGRIGVVSVPVIGSFLHASAFKLANDTLKYTLDAMSEDARKIIHILNEGRVKTV